MTSSRQQYIERYAEYAMEQMRRYGIPASITLAQGIIESADGKSTLANTANNHFGVKGAYNGNYVLADDDKPNEKFCSYATVGDSYEHHSQVLKNSSRYKNCFKLAPDDYKGWTKGIERAGYATGGDYAASLQRIIEAKGELDLTVYNDKLNIGCRLTSVTKWEKKPYQPANEEMPF